VDPFFPVFLTLGRLRRRRSIYREWMMENVDLAETDTIRLNLQRQHALGSARLRAAIEQQLVRRAGPAKIGRPCKHRGSP